MQFLYIIFLLSIYVVLPFISVLSEIYYHLVVKTKYPFFYYEEVIVIGMFVYSLLPFFISPKKNFQIMGPRNYVIEFGLLKNLTFVGLPLLVILRLFSIFNIRPEILNPLFIMVTIVISAVLLRLFSNIRKRDFRFYYAKGCLSFISKKTDDSDKVNYFITALNSYNKYLQHSLKLQINNIKNIYSKILIFQVIDKNEIIRSISEAFESNDKLQPLKCMLTFSDTQNGEQFLVEGSTWDKAKELATFMAAIIPVMISIIELLQKFQSGQ